MAPDRAASPQGRCCCRERHGEVHCGADGERHATPQQARSRGLSQGTAGAPPSHASGSLAKGMYWVPASGELRATAYVGNSAQHASLLEFGGCVLRPTSGKVMHWTDSAGSWYHAALPAPEHPFLGPTTEEAIDDGELERVAIDAFREYDP